jgi:acetyl esterase/lipase
MLKYALLSTCLVMSLCLTTAPRVYGNENVINNVGYSDVTGLDYFRADDKLVYGDDDSSLQYGLLWIPRELAAPARAPLIILIHGGCWLNAYDIQHSFPLASALAGEGYAVWSVEYRRTGDTGGGWPGSFEDVVQAVQYIHSLERFPVDFDHTVIVGHSAGGHLALLAGARHPHVKAVVGLAAITDVVSYSRGENSCQKATVDFLGGDYESRPAAYREANPAGQALHANNILLHGDADTIVPLQQAELPGASSRRLGGAGHFDWIHPGTRAYQLLLSTVEEVLQK